MKTQTYCPAFPGFYETRFSIDLDNDIECLDEIRIENGLKPIDNFNDLKVDYDGYENEIARKFCSQIEALLNDMGVKCSIVFESVVSPREYNFTTDSINCTIEIKNSLHIVRLINENFEKWTEYLKERFTSYDGFISYYDSDWLDLFEALKHNTKCGVILEFLLLNYSDEINEIYPYDLEVHAGDYILNYEALKTIINDSDIECRYIKFEHSLWLLGGRIFSTFGEGVKYVFGEINGSFFKAIYNENKELVFSQKYDGYELAEEIYLKAIVQ